MTARLLVVAVFAAAAAVDSVLFAVLTLPLLAADLLIGLTAWSPR